LNVATRTAVTTKRSAPSFSLATLFPGAAAAGPTRLPRGAWIAGGAMALTIVALATALVLRPGAPDAAAPGPAPATPAAVADAATPATAGPGGAPAMPDARTTAGAPGGAAQAPAGPAAAQPAPAPAPEPQPVAHVCANCGVIDSYNSVQVQGGTNGVGAVAGGIGGAVIGSKIAGRGNHTAGGLIGAIGGGLLGNAVEKHYRVYTVYDVHVRMDDGTMRTVRQSARPAVGSHVTVDGKTLHPAPAPAS